MPADCDRIVAVAERGGIIAAVGFKRRFFPAVTAAKQFLSTPSLTAAPVIDDHWPSEFWANDPAQRGGNVLSQGGHMMDKVLHPHPAPPVRVDAADGNRHHPARAIVDTAAITRIFADGAVANVSTGDVGVPSHASTFARQTHSRLCRWGGTGTCPSAAKVKMDAQIPRRVSKSC